MKRVPLVPTLIVALAVAGMIALGLWQLDRARWKEALIARYAAAGGRPPIAFPMIPTDEALLFRRAGAFCLQPVSETVAAGRSRDGRSGWRHLVLCRRGAEGPGITVDIGWSDDFASRSGWRGGAVAGTIGSAPSHDSVLAGLFGRTPPRELLLVADAPAPGLAPSARPDPAQIPNNHRGYAVQWFLFASVAAIIYVLALRRRERRAGRP